MTNDAADHFTTAEKQFRPGCVDGGNPMQIAPPSAQATTQAAPISCRARNSKGTPLRCGSRARSLHPGSVQTD